MWLIYTLLSTTALTTRNIFNKFGVDSQDQYITSLATFLFSLPIATGSLILLSEIQITDASFWPLLALRILFDTVALLSLLTAFKFKSVSFVVPLLSLSPIMTTVFAYFLRGDVVNYIEIAGIIFIAASCMIVYVGEKQLTLPENTPGLRKATGLVLLTTLLYSILDPLHPEIIERSNTYTYFFISTVIFVIIFSIIAFFKSRQNLKKMFTERANLITNFAVGTSLGFEVLFLFLALTTAPAVALVSSIRTTNVALSSLGGFAIFRERFSLLKVVGIMGSIGGVFLVTFG
jgi:uncharacterized membrane protein